MFYKQSQVDENFCVQQDAERVDFENYLITLLRFGPQPDVEDKYCGFLFVDASLKGLKTFKISTIYFHYLQPLVLVLFEENPLRDKEEQENMKIWRETFLEALTSKTLKHSGQCIAFLKSLEREISKQGRIGKTAILQEIAK